MNGSGTVSKSDAWLTHPGSLPVLINALARKRHGHPQRDIITVLIGQCRSYGVYPGMGPKILETIEAIEKAA